MGEDDEDTREKLRWIRLAGESDLSPWQKREIYEGRKGWWKTPEVTIVRKEDKTEIYDSYYSRFKTPKYTITDPKPKDKDCFVATAVYGDYGHPNVQTLQWFRENMLREHFAGRLFIKVYECVGPHLARVVEGRRYLQDFFRGLFDPLADKIMVRYHDRISAPNASLESRL